MSKTKKADESPLDIDALNPIKPLHMKGAWHHPHKLPWLDNPKKFKPLRPEKRKEIFLEFFELGLTSREIAKAFRISVVTLRRFCMKNFGSAFWNEFTKRSYDYKLRQEMRARELKKQKRTYYEDHQVSALAPGEYPINEAFIKEAVIERFGKTATVYKTETAPTKWGIAIVPFISEKGFSTEAEVKLYCRAHDFIEADLNAAEAAIRTHAQLTGDIGQSIEATLKELLHVSQSQRDLAERTTDHNRAKDSA